TLRFPGEIFAADCLESVSGAALFLALFLYGIPTMGNLALVALCQLAGLVEREATVDRHPAAPAVRAVLAEPGALAARRQHHPEPGLRRIPIDHPVLSWSPDILDKRCRQFVCSHRPRPRSGLILALDRSGKHRVSACSEYQRKRWDTR